jgi:hypothetical protein
MSPVGLERTISVLELAKTVLALGRAATEIGQYDDKFHTVNITSSELKNC